MSGVFSPTRAKINERTLRTDKWWLQPLLTFGVLFSFVIYSTFRAFEGANYYKDHLVSPFYSPCLSQACIPETTVFGWTPISAEIFNFALSPALIILIFPLGFRMTCYYYRKAYYRSFWLSPPACGVAEPHKKYTGETRPPLIFQNAHRWFFYAGLVFNDGSWPVANCSAWPVCCWLRLHRHCSVWGLRQRCWPRRCWPAGCSGAVRPGRCRCRCWRAAQSGDHLRSRYFATCCWSSCAMASPAPCRRP